jgi:hypothetical protein
MRTAVGLIASLLLAGVAFAGDAGDPKNAKKDASAKPVVQRTPEQIAELKKEILAGLADAKPKLRAEAADKLVFAWPDTTPALDEALASENPTVRMEAACLLRREELGDMRERIRTKLYDPLAAVRILAVRAARHLKWPEIEPEFVRLLAGDASFEVKQETLVGLETLGTIACAKTVLDGWVREEDKGRRSRFKRVLVAVLKCDKGEDVDAWRTAIEQAETAARAAKAPQQPPAKQPATR